MKISLPIKNIETFRIESCIKVDQLLKEMSRRDKKKKNLFTESLNYFKKFTTNLKNSYKTQVNEF